MKRLFNNLFYKTYKAFLIILGLYFCFIYSLRMIAEINNLMFADESVAAVKFTFSKLLFIPLSAYLAYISVLILIYIINTIRMRAFVKPDKILALKHMGLLVLLTAATLIAMQFNTVLYTDGRIKSNNFIESLSPEYTVEDYDRVTFYGESVGLGSQNHAPRISFQFYMVFSIDEEKYIQFYPVEFRNYKTIYDLGKTLGDKFKVMPEGGFTSNIIANMSESDYYLYKMMYKGVIPSDDDYETDEEETEQEHYAFDGFYDFN